MLSRYKSLISPFLLDFLESQRSAYKDHAWGKDVIDRFVQFTPGGKMFRGGLVLGMYEMLSHKDITPLLPAAAGVEMVSAALLIHDDLIDRDELRRGHPTFVKQYQALTAEQNYASSDHMGLSLALCAGDVGLMWGFMLVNQLELPAEQKTPMLQLFTHEYCGVGLGEMLDVQQASSPRAVTEKDILTLYRYKTARYTFTLPMLLGAYAAKASPEVLTLIETLSETLGILFQIKDDELGLFGSEAETGKLAISDVREGKKTLYYHYVFQLASAQVQQRLKLLFGKPDLTESELEEVRTAVRHSGTQRLVESYLEKYQKEVATLITQLPIDEDSQASFQQFVTANVLRKN